MFFGRKNCTKLFFKLLLLVVYFSFFSVQFFLRYTSANSQQSLGFRAHFPAQAASEKLAYKNTHNPGKLLCYLNKRFQPQDAVMLPVFDYGFRAFYRLVSNKSREQSSYLAVRKLNATSLRGPPNPLS